MRKKLISAIALFIVVLFCTSSVFALTINTGTTGTTGNTPNSSNGDSQSSTTNNNSATIMELVEKNTCKIDLKDPVTNDVVGNFTKELTGIDTTKKTATLTLTLKNIMEQEKITKPVEVFLILDDSHSMTNKYNGKQKMEYVAETANIFTDSLFEYFTNPKIGIVSFSSVDTTTSGGVSLQLGTKNDAKLLLPLSDSKDAIKTKISEYKNSHGPLTNIEAGLTIAEENFSDSTSSEKYIILISDGVPNLCLNTETTMQYSGIIAEQTKKKLEDMDEAGYHIFSVLMGLNEANTNCPASSIANSDEPRTYRSLAEEIFGTVSSPTAGDFFYIDYENLDTTVNSDIYGDITYIKDNSLKNITIKDYFPKEIIDNFNFEYVKSPNIGKVSEKVDTSDNSITWNIELLNAGEVATLSYKLTLKDKYDTKILGKVLPTNSKVDIKYNYNNVEGNSNSTVSPTIRLTADNTITKKPIPQTGSYSFVFFMITVAGIVIFASIKATQIRRLNIK